MLSASIVSWSKAWMKFHLDLICVVYPKLGNAIFCGCLMSHWRFICTKVFTDWTAKWVWRGEIHFLTSTPLLWGSIAAHESGGQWILAAVVLDKLMTSTKPSSISFNSMTSTAASSGQLREAFSMKVGWLTSGFPCRSRLQFRTIPNPGNSSQLLSAVYQTTINSYLRIGSLDCWGQEWQTALRLQHGSLRKLHADKDPISFATVLGACQHALKWSMASFFLRKAPW